MTYREKQDMKLLIIGNSALIFASLITIFIFLIPVNFILTYTPTPEDELEQASPGFVWADDLDVTLSIIVGFVIGGAFYLIFSTIGKILILIGLSLYSKKSKYKNVRQAGKKSLLVLGGSIFASWFCSFIMMAFLLKIQNHPSDDDIFFFIIMMLIVWEFLMILSFSISNSLFTHLIGKVKVISIPNICFCIFIAPAPIIIFSLIGMIELTKTGALVLFSVAIVILIIGILTASLNIISLGVTHWLLRNKEKNVKKELEVQK